MADTQTTTSAAAAPLSLAPATTVEGGDAAAAAPADPAKAKTVADTGAPTPAPPPAAAAQPEPDAGDPLIAPYVFAGEPAAHPHATLMQAFGAELGAAPWEPSKFASLAEALEDMEDVLTAARKYVDDPADAADWFTGRQAFRAQTRAPAADADGAA
jgi:hypothetical protein